MNKDLIERIRVFNNIKYGTSDNETRIKIRPTISIVGVE